MTHAAQNSTYNGRLRLRGRYQNTAVAVAKRNCLSAASFSFAGNEDAFGVLEIYSDKSAFLWFSLKASALTFLAFRLQKLHFFSFCKIKEMNINRAIGIQIEWGPKLNLE